MSALYTGKGDGGTTKFIGSEKRVTKSSSIAEALGNLDELNSFLGLVKVEAEKSEFEISGQKFVDMVEDIQQNIFIVCAHIAGSEKKLGEEKTKRAEEIIADCEKELPPITTFTIAGGAELSARFDFARTLARRGERRVVAVNDDTGSIDQDVLKYLNRLSSVLFALARLTNLKFGIKESAPNYN